MMFVSDFIRSEIRARYSATHAPDIERQFEATTLTFLDAPDRDLERDRVHLAILKLANGNAAEIPKALKVAAWDWRDTLVGSGLGNGNWPDVLRAAGFPVPPALNTSG